MDTRTQLARKLVKAFSQFKRLNWKQSPVVGLKHSELAVLYCIKQSTSSDTPGVMVSEISNKLKVTSPTVTQLLRPLEDNGYVERNIDENDRRAVRIKLTATGESILEEAMEVLLRYFEGLVDYLGEEKSKVLINLLSEVFTYFNDIKN